MSDYGYNESDEVAEGLGSIDEQDEDDE